MPKKKSRTQSQSQSQRVIVNIGTATARKRKRRKGGGGAGPGGGGGYYHNLAPTIINSPQVDYTPLLAMMQYQTRTLQTEGIKNPVTPLSSVTQALPAEQMAGEAAIRRAGKTSADFSQQAHMDRREEAEEPEEPMAIPSPTGTAPQSPFREMQEFQQGTAPLRIVMERPPDEYYTEQLIPNKPPPPPPSSPPPPRSSLPQRQAVNAAEETFVPKEAERGRLGSAGSEGSGTAFTFPYQSEELAQVTKKGRIKKRGPLSDEEFDVYKSLSQLRPTSSLTQNRSRALQILRKRLEEHPRGEST